MAGRHRSWRTVATSLTMVGFVFSILPAGVTASGPRGSGGTPIVLFPAFHFTRLLVTVDNQTAAPDCLRSGTFTDWFLNDRPSPTFSQICRDKLLTVRFNPNRRIPMPD